MGRERSQQQACLSRCEVKSQTQHLLLTTAAARPDELDCFILTPNNIFY